MIRLGESRAICFKAEELGWRRISLLQETLLGWGSSWVPNQETSRRYRNVSWAGVLFQHNAKNPLKWIHFVFKMLTLISLSMYSYVKQVERKKLAILQLNPNVRSGYALGGRFPICWKALSYVTGLSTTVLQSCRGTLKARYVTVFIIDWFNW